MSKRLTIDDIYDPEKRINFDGTTYPDVIWCNDEYFLLRKTDSKTNRTEWMKISARTGESAAFYDAEQMQRALKCLDEMTDDQAARLAHMPNYILNANQTAILLNHANDLYYYRLGSDDTVRLTATATPEVSEEFSPDGTMISFVRDNNLFVIDIETRREWALTSDGSEKILNGRLDWVYQEEIYGRDNFKGYWWSPDSKRIAYLRLDESALRPFPVTDHVPVHPEVESTNYPLAGDSNPRVQLGFVDAHGGPVTWVNTAKYDSIDFLIVRVGWTPDGSSVVYQVQDREQHWLDLNIRNKTLFREQQTTWVGVTGEPKWLKDGSFLWISERSGWAHIYHYSRDGELIRPITEGRWEVRSLLALDEENGFVYFIGTKDSPLGNQAYRVRIDGSHIERLTLSRGNHRSILNPGATHFFDYWSDINTPTQYRIHSSNGSIVHVIDENPVPAMAEYTFGKIEFLHIPTQDGFAMQCMMLKPPDFDPSQRYPVMAYVYGGPHHPQVVDAWGGEKHMWHRMLAQMGYIVWICDNRTASGLGSESTWPLHRRAGKLELRDLEDAIGWLKSQPFIDGDRIGLWGWSYGGYLTLYALTHSATFKIGIAGAAVTDWRNYDSIYTERYLDMPQNNPIGYDESSVVKSAADLRGKLLLIHGTTDDNVHLQNTMQFVYELQKAGKQFELMIYPRTRHAVTAPAMLKHLRTLMTTFILENL
jgi:dipeptidyl-peptidase-4